MGISQCNISKQGKTDGFLLFEAKIPFTPYTLRHCWAVRTIGFNLPSADAARQMGHSITIHERVYHRWITPQHQQRLYDLLLANPLRPQPPKKSYQFKLKPGQMM